MASYQTIFWVFLRLGLTAFGGPAMVPYIRREAVERRGWLDDDSFRVGVGLAQGVPGATAMQVAAYVGYRTRGVLGALAAYLGFGLPAFFMVLGLSWLYVAHGDISAVSRLFTGLRVVVVAVVAHAAWGFVRRYCEGWRGWLLFVAAFGSFALGWNPILILIGSCLVAMALYRRERGWPACEKGTNGADGGLRRVLPVLLVVLAGLGLLFLADRELFDISLLMAKIDLFAYGGGYVSLPLMLHEVVNVQGWMNERVFMDGIAMGQITPGPIVMTATFVGYMVRGFWGAVLATVYVFAPSFLIVTAMAGFADRLRSSALFARALRGSLVTLAGLMAAVSYRFVVAVQWDATAVALAVAAFALLWRGVDILWVVLGGGVVAMLVL